MEDGIGNYSTLETLLIKVLNKENPIYLKGTKNNNDCAEIIEIIISPFCFNCWLRENLTNSELEIVEGVFVDNVQLPH